MIGLCIVLIYWLGFIICFSVMFEADARRLYGKRTRDLSFDESETVMAGGILFASFIWPAFAVAALLDAMESP